MKITDCNFCTSYTQNIGDTLDVLIIYGLLNVVGLYQIAVLRVTGLK